MALLAIEAWRADSLRTVLAPTFVVLGAVGSMLLLFWLKLGVDSLIARSSNGVVVAAAGFTVSLGCLFVFTGASVRTVRQLMEAMALSVGSQLIGLATYVPRLDVFAASEGRRRLAVLRARRQDFAGLVNGLSSLVALTTRLALAFVLLFFVHPLLTLLLPGTLANAIHSFRSQARLDEAEEADAWRWQVLDDLERIAVRPESAKEVMAWAAEDFLVGRHRALAHESRKVAEVRRRTATAQSIGGSALALLYGGATVFVAYQFGVGEATAGDLVLVLVLAVRLNEVTLQMVPHAAWMIQALALPRYLAWLRQVGAEASAITPPPGRAERMRFERVSYRYPGAGSMALSDVNVEIPVGSVVAVVGRNGAGKTTLVNLMTGLYRPTGGRVLVDDADLAEVDLRTWRMSLSGAFQDAARLELILRESVGVGDLLRLEDGSAVAKALRRAHAQELVDRLPLGPNTQLGTTFGGVNLSAGEWQVVALARGMMRDSPFLLVLDEPTATLDVETEDAYYRSLTRAARETGGDMAITLFVTHRMAATAAADFVILLAGGRVAEVGTHRELMTRNGLYARLYTRQAAGYR